MARKHGPSVSLSSQIRATLASVRLGELSDGELLARYVATRDGEPFTELARRLGPTVLGVCRRLLGTGPDAEDAFQVVFMVLARRAGSVRPPGRVAAWLHGVALLTARKMRYLRSRRAARESATEPPFEPTAPYSQWEPDLAEVLDTELNRLPAKYRLPVVLCEVRELTVAQAAAELGWPIGTVASRLSRGREVLANRLRRRGVAAGSLVAAGGLWQPAGAHGLSRLVGVAVTFAGGAVPPAITSPLLGEVLRAMTLNKVRMACAGLLAATVLGGFGLLHATVGATPPAREAPSVAKEDPHNKAAGEGDRRPDADEALMIQVTTVKDDIHGELKEVSIEAKVLGVERTSFGIKTGNTVTIRYTDTVENSGIPPLEKDGVYPAFLNRSDKACYQPAAGEESFRITPVRGRGKKSPAEQFGEDMLVVDRFMRVSPSDPKAEGLQKAVVAIGGFENRYVWVQARLGWGIQSLKAQKGARELSPEETKEIDSRIAIYQRTSVLIDAPK